MVIKKCRGSLAQHLRMSSPSTIPPLPGMQNKKPLGPNREAVEMTSADRDSESVSYPQRALSLEFAGADSKASYFESNPKIVLPDSDAHLEDSIQLPIELWERVIDLVAEDQKDNWEDNHCQAGAYAARLRELGTVCRGWYARCRFRALEKLDVSDMDKKQVYRLINTLKEHSGKCRIIQTISFDLFKKPIGNFGSFAVCMAQRLPQVKLLRLLECEWIVEQLHTQVFLHVTLAFGSITALELFSMTFPSAAVFGRLIRALPHLSSLVCRGIRFEKRRDVVGPFRVLHPLRLDTVDLSYSADVIDFLASIGAHIRHLSSHDRHLKKWSALFPANSKSLLSLDISLARYDAFSDDGT
ncbi:uncharacterized protein FIBRA_02919 [Fibroporia radiculosa]|uniref:F-box domain-containing protein n=1 Tax=Fibroporia radiculosa TaxID=599839 RepID=J4G3C5_9APHY|nr:uncharacterized protein FIBRA_02919 [Fibroporia radiculosa]CCM00873.1 predicted protein [Fibroporia radiculosa]